jgi:DoxX-like protein
MPDSETAATPKAMYWTGWVLSGLVVAGLIFSGVLKLVKPNDVTAEFTRLGWPDVALGLGIVEIACAVIYAIPRTAVLGAILVTGYLGGAIATHVRIEEGFIPPAVMGVLAWLGVYLRDARLRALLPLRT